MNNESTIYRTEYGMNRPMHPLERVRGKWRLFAFASGLCIAGTLLGCRETQTIDDNVPPTAVVDVVGQKLEEGVLMLEFDGDPIALTLDGTGSKDIDGEVVAYMWFSGTPEEVVAEGTDGGTNGETDGSTNAGTSGETNSDIAVLRRRVPEGESKNWPADKAKPKVEIGEGLWFFTLYVRDDDDAVSEPATLKVSVGNAAVAACVAAVAEATSGSVSEACAQCACERSPQCQTDVSACNDGCWALMGCASDNCPDGEMSCVIDACADLLGAGTAAIAAGECVRPCEDVCGD